MASETGRGRYLSSIAEELSSQSTRVRDLIGDQHWLSDGHHKEYLLAGVLRRHLPHGILVSRGFVVSPHEENVCSTEQDVLVIDTTKEAPLFNQSDLAICFPRTVLAAISVKTTLTSATMADVFKGLKSVREAAKHDIPPRSLWCGGFFFEAGDAIDNDETKIYDYLLGGLRDHAVEPPGLPPQHPYPIGPDLICCVPDLVFKIDYGSGIESDGPNSIRTLGYRCDSVGPAIFIAQIIDHVSLARGLGDSNFSDFVEHSRISQIDAGRVFNP